MTNNGAIVADWQEFVAWAIEGGYDESYFNLHDSKCADLQESYLDELRETETE